MRDSPGDDLFETSGSATALAFLSPPAPSGAATAVGTSQRPDRARPLPTARMPSLPFHRPAAPPPPEPEQAELRLTIDSEGE